MLNLGGVIRKYRITWSWYACHYIHKCCVIKCSSFDCKVTLKLNRSCDAFESQFLSIFARASSKWKMLWMRLFYCRWGWFSAIFSNRGTCFHDFSLILLCPYYSTIVLEASYCSPTPWGHLRRDNLDGLSRMFLLWRFRSWRKYYIDSMCCPLGVVVLTRLFGKSWCRWRMRSKRWVMVTQRLIHLC